MFYFETQPVTSANLGSLGLLFQLVKSQLFLNLGPTARLQTLLLTLSQTTLQLAAPSTLAMK